jgi:ClpP class serine protease
MTHPPAPTYHRILSKMLFEPWFITTAKFSSMMQQLRARIENPSARLDIDDPDTEEIPATPRPGVQSGMGIAIIQVYGIIGKRLSWLEMMCGGCDLETITELLTQADEDADIHTIILDFDSPAACIPAARVRRPHS